MGRKDGKSSAGRLVLFRGTQSPEGNRSTTKLGEPAFKLRLCSVMGKTRHVKNLASLGKKGTNIGSCVHGSRQNIGMLLGRLGLANQATKHACKSDGLLHGAARRGGGQRLQMER